MPTQLQELYEDELTIKETESGQIPHDDDTGEQPGKKAKIGQNKVEEQNDPSVMLPTEVWAQILSYVHYDHNQNRPFFFKPSYARVNKLFNAFADYWSNREEKSYRLMTYCLVGKKATENLIKELNCSPDTQYKNSFYYIFSAVFQLFKQNNFDQIEERLLAFKDYDVEDEEFIEEVNRPLSLGEIPQFIFQMDAKEEELLAKLTNDKRCYPALLAMAYIQKNKSLEQIEQLASVYAEVGLLRGGLFILEFCFRLSIHRDVKPTDFDLVKNNVLQRVLDYSLSWPKVGGYLKYYLMEHYQFDYDHKFILQSIHNCQNNTPAIKLLLNDVRHYKAPEVMLRMIQVGYIFNRNYYSSGYPRNLRDNLILLKHFFEKYVRNFSFDKDEKDLMIGLYNTLDRNHHATILKQLCEIVKTVQNYMDGNAAPTSLSFLTRAEETENQVEPIDDLAEFFDAPTEVEDNQKEFYQQFAELCQQVESKLTSATI